MSKYYDAEFDKYLTELCACQRSIDYFTQTGEYTESRAKMANYYRSKLYQIKAGIYKRLFELRGGIHVCQQ